MLTAEQRKHIGRILAPEIAEALPDFERTALLPQIPEGQSAEFYEGVALAILMVCWLIRPEPLSERVWSMLGAAAAVRYQEAFPSQIEA